MAIDSELEQRLESLAQAIARLERRLDAVEERTGLRSPPRPGWAGWQRPPQPAPTEPPAAAAPPPPTPPQRPAEAPAGEPPRARTVDLEDLLGGRVLAWVGGSAVLLGIVFFLGMAIRRGWIDEPTRTVLALLGSSALVSVGIFLHERKGQTEAALAAVAAGIAGLFATLVVATQVYDLLRPELGLVGAGLTGAVATALAVRWESQLIAALGIVGALLAPVLVDAGTSSVALAFIAVALVSAVGVLLWQRWSWLAVAAFVTTAPQLVGWMADTYDDAIAVTLAVLAAFWALYVAAAIGYELRVPTERLRFSSASLLLANALFAAGAGWAALEADGHGDAATGWVVGAALVHVVLGSLTLRGRISREIALLCLAVGVGLSAVGAALALEGPALVAAWSAEAVVLAWLARRMGLVRGYIGAAVFLALAAAHAILIDARPDLLAADPELRAVVAVVLVTGAAFAVARLYAGPWPQPPRFADALGLAGLAYLAPIAFEGLPVVAAWAVIAVALAISPVRRRVPDAWRAAPGFVALAAFHVLAIEAPPLALRDGVERLSVSAAAIALVAAAAFTLARAAEWPRDMRLALEIGGAAAAVYLPSVAIVDLTSGAPAEPGQTPQVLLSAFWSLTGLVAVVYGLLRDDRRFRFGGLTLLGLAIAKVFFYDMRSLDELYRVLSFIALGLLLLAGAYAYQRIRVTVDETGETG